MCSDQVDMLDTPLFQMLEIQACPTLPNTPLFLADSCQTQKGQLLS